MFPDILLNATAPILNIGGLKLSLWWWPFVFTFFKVMFILLDVLILLAIILLVYRYQSFKARVYEAVEEAIASGKVSQGRIRRKWEEIKEESVAEKVQQRKKAVSKAEKILDDVLKMANIPGENLEKRLGSIPEGQLNFQDDIVWAFRFKERLETDPEFTPDDEEIKRAFYIFERTLKDLNIL